MHEAFVVEMIETSKDITLDEMVVRLGEELNVRIGRFWVLGRGGRYHRLQQPDAIDFDFDDLVVLCDCRGLGPVSAQMSSSKFSPRAV